METSTFTLQTVDLKLLAFHLKAKEILAIKKTKNNRFYALYVTKTFDLAKKQFSKGCSFISQALLQKFYLENSVKKHQTTLFACQCPDKKYRKNKKLFCKHQIFLAEKYEIELAVLEGNQKFKQQQHLKKKVQSNTSIKNLVEADLTKVPPGFELVFQCEATETDYFIKYILLMMYFENGVVRRKPIGSMYPRNGYWELASPFTSKIYAKPKTQDEAIGLLLLFAEEKDDMMGIVA